MSRLRETNPHAVYRCPLCGERVGLRDRDLEELPLGWERLDPSGLDAAHTACIADLQSFMLKQGIYDPIIGHRAFEALDAGHIAPPERPKKKSRWEYDCPNCSSGVINAKDAGDYSCPVCGFVLHVSNVKNPASWKASALSLNEKLSTLPVGSPEYKAAVDAAYAASVKDFVSGKRKRNPTTGIQFVIGFPRPAHKGSGAGGSRVQSVLFDKGSWLAGRSWRQGYERAKSWLKDNGFKYDDVEETEDKLRFRQEEPGEFVRFRTITAGGSGNMSKSKSNPAQCDFCGDTRAVVAYRVDGGQSFFSCRHCADWGYLNDLQKAGRLEYMSLPKGWGGTPPMGNPPLLAGKLHTGGAAWSRQYDEPTKRVSCKGCGKTIVGSFAPGEYQCSGCGESVEVK